MNSISNQKAYHTALVISPPPSLWEQIQSIRKFYDSAYERWMPHINMTFPFVTENDFDKAHELLQKEFDDFEAFPLSFNTMDHFTHSEKCVIWLKPECANDELNKIEEKIIKVIPHCNDLTTKSKDGFQGHLTLGHSDEKYVEKRKNSFLSKWSPIKFTVNELYMIIRKGTENPFYVVKTIRLKGATEKSYCEDINKEMKGFEKPFYQTNTF